MAIELNDSMTHDDITSAVDSIIESRKGDGELIAEERDKPVGDLSAEEDSGADSDQQVEETGDESSPDWLDDDLRAEMTAYGIDEDALADFSSREEVERAMRLFDKTALEAGRKAMADGEKTPKRGEDGRFQKPEDEPVKAEASYEIQLDKDLYDEDLIGELTRMRDHYESRLSALEARQAENDAKAEVQAFDGLVDGLGHADLFGTSGKETPKQLQRRQELFDAAKAQQIGMKVMGRDVQVDQSFILRVARMAFTEEFSKKDLKAATRKISKQSNGRMGGGATRPSDPPETLRDEMRRLYKEYEGS